MAALVMEFPLPTRSSRPHVPAVTLLNRKAALCAIAAMVRSGATSAAAVAESPLARIALRNPVLNAFTTITAERALNDARGVDAKLARRRGPGPLAGVPFAVKNLFDIAGVVTLAGSKIDAERPPAAADATLVRRCSKPGRCWSGASTWTNTPTASRPRTAITGRRTTRTIRRASPAARRADRRRRSRAASCRWRSARTPTARSGCPPRCAASSG